MPCPLPEKEYAERSHELDVSFDTWDEQLDRVEARLELEDRVEVRLELEESTPVRQMSTWDLDAAFSSPKMAAEMVPGQLQVTVLWVTVLSFGTL